MNAPCCFLITFLFIQLLPMASVYKFQTDLFHDFFVQRLISSCAHPNGNFANTRESRVVW